MTYIFVDQYILARKGHKGGYYVDQHAPAKKGHMGGCYVDQYVLAKKVTRVAAM